MDEKLKPLVDAIQEKFNVQVMEFRGEVTLIVSHETIQELVKELRDTLGFNFLADLTAVDYWPQETPRFHVVYQVRNIDLHTHLCIRVPLDGHAPQMDTIERIYPNANWFEREVWDMFGIRFSGHSDLRRILLPSDWVGHPLRKDYPLGYEEVQFTFNYDEIDVRKPYAKE
jgi:NADH-quinone oxidoreductase subunit C